MLILKRRKGEKVIVGDDFIIEVICLIPRRRMVCLDIQCTDHNYQLWVRQHEDSKKLITPTYKLYVSVRNIQVNQVSLGFIAPDHVGIEKMANEKVKL